MGERWIVVHGKLWLVRAVVHGWGGRFHLRYIVGWKDISMKNCFLNWSIQVCMLSERGISRDHQTSGFGKLPMYGRDFDSQRDWSHQYQVPSRGRK